MFVWALDFYIRDFKKEPITDAKILTFISSQCVESQGLRYDLTYETGHGS